MNQAVLLFLGTILGGILTFLGSYLSSKHISKLELKKLSLSFLIEKRIIIEQLIEKCLYDVTGNLEEDEHSVIEEFEAIARFLRLKSHYFLDSNEFHTSLSALVDIENEGEWSSIEILYAKRDFNNKFNQFIRKELETTVRSMNKMMDIK